MGTAAEREVSKARLVRELFRRESIGIKTFRVGPEIRMTMGNIRAHGYDRICRNVITADDIILDRGTRKYPCGRIEPHRFFNHLHGVCEFAKVREVGRAASQYMF